MSHFDFTGETCFYRGRTLRRIRALKYLRHSGVLPGVLGGWVEAKENLTDEAWVADNAKVYGDAIVSDDAVISGEAEVYEHAQVCQRSRVTGQAKVYGHAVVSGTVNGCAHVFGQALLWSSTTRGCVVAGHAKVFDNARILNESWIGDRARVFGCASVQEHARIGGVSAIFDSATVTEHAWVSGQAQVFGTAHIAGKAWIYGSAQIYENARVFDLAQVCSHARMFGYAWAYGHAEVTDHAHIFGYAQAFGQAQITADQRLSGTARHGDPTPVENIAALTKDELDARAARYFTRGVFVFDTAQQCFQGGFETTVYFDHIGPNTYREVLKYCDGLEIEPEPGTEMYFTGSPRQLKAVVLAGQMDDSSFMGYPVVFEKHFLTLFIGDTEIP